MGGYAYVTLLTRDNYLPGILVLQRSLRAVGTRYPLVAMITPGLAEATLRIMEREGITTTTIDYLMPLPEQNGPVLDVYDGRFHDTWTKLRVFGLEGYDRIVMLDSDMVIRKNMDDLFSLDIPRDWIAATHVCACNPRQLPHYPSDWIPANCAHSSVTHPGGITSPPEIAPDSPRPYSQLNSGLVVLHPSHELEAQLVEYLHTSPLVSTWTFPDQDLLSSFFAGRWRVLPYVYNALQPMAKVHPPLWRDEEVHCLHYIGPTKPWNGREAYDPLYKTSNDWWWEVYDELMSELEANGPEDVEAMKRFVKE